MVVAIASAAAASAAISASRGMSTSLAYYTPLPPLYEDWFLWCAVFMVIAVGIGMLLAIFLPSKY